MKLDVGEVLCSHCESGKVIDIDDNYCGTKPCSFCKGKGKLDWIENIVGVSPNYINPRSKFYSNYQNTIKFSDLLFDYEKMNRNIGP